MAVEQFLRFWSQYNALIIELLIAAILLIVVYLAYRTFFGEEESHSLVDGKSLDVDGIEKALQKILAQQTSFVAAGGSAPAVSLPAMAAAPASVTSGAPPPNTAELAKLKADIVERDKTIEDLRAQLAAAKAAPASAPAAGSPEDAEERRKQEAYLKNLEARLAEYEIISEDIADLSFYKEENSKLQKEIESLRSGTDVPAPVEAEPIDELAAVVAELNIGNGVADEPAPASTPEPEVAAEVAPDVQFEEPPAVAEATAAAEAEEALREMAEISSSTPSQVGAPKTGTEEVALIDQFEDFVKKGS